MYNPQSLYCIPLQFTNITHLILSWTFLRIIEPKTSSNLFLCICVHGKLNFSIFPRLLQAVVHSFMWIVSISNHFQTYPALWANFHKFWPQRNKPTSITDTVRYLSSQAFRYLSSQAFRYLSSQAFRYLSSQAFR